jgi:hypothetical protein
MYYMKLEKENKIKSDSEIQDKSHGGPYDRGGADAWYARSRNPHKFPNGTYNGPEVTDLTEREIEEYNYGYDTGEFNGKGYDLNY